MAVTTCVWLLVTLLSGCAAQPYSPNWDSLDSRPLPSWYDEAKFGIFLHWGVYSVPSWGVSNGGASGEWFWWMWQGANQSAYIDFMQDNFAPGFTYPDFAPMFSAELWNPNEWAELFAASGAKYVILTSKHHEGWCNWPSAASWNWNSMDAGPHRDLVGELTTAVRGAGLRMGLYHSLFEWFNPLYLADKAANFSTNTYVTNILTPELHDIVNSYAPDVIWSDGDWEAPDTYWQSQEFLAWLYNEAPNRNDVVVNDRWGIGDLCHHGGYYTCSDRYNPGHVQNHKWENDMTLDTWSWGFRRNANITEYLTVWDVLSQLVSTVSCGGNLVLNMGPTHDGLLIPLFQERLLAIGAWMNVNGQAIYSTQPWRAQNETAVNVWYTSTPKSVYAIALSWPENNVLELTEPITQANTMVFMLGLNELPLKWTAPGNGQPGMTITIPPLSPPQVPCQDAWTFQLINVS